MFTHHYHQIMGSSNGLSVFWGAFLGAFFAFVFGFITYVITKRRERFVQHKNALVKLERMLNKHLNDLAVLEAIANDGERIVGQGKVTSNRLFRLEIPAGVDMEIGSIDLVNKLFTYQTSIDRLNFNTSTINHTLTRLEDLFINGRVVPTENFDFIKSTLQKLIQEIPQLNERATKFLILVRIHIGKLKSKSPFIYGALNTQWELDISQRDIDEENEKLRQEIARLREDYENNVF